MKLPLSSGPEIIALTIAILSLGFVLFSRLSAKAGSVVSPTQALDVATLVDRVANDLEALEGKRLDAQKAALLTLETFDLEVNFVVRASSSTSASARYEVLTVGSDSREDLERAQKIRLHFTAAAPRGGAVAPSDAK